MLSKTPQSTSGESEKSASKRARGRPKGAKNKPREVVVVVPAQCPNNACRSSEFKRQPNPIRKRDIRTLFRGQYFRTVVHVRVQCDKCGQHFIVREYLDPEVSNDETG